MAPAPRGEKAGGDFPKVQQLRLLSGRQAMQPTHPNAQFGPSPSIASSVVLPYFSFSSAPFVALVLFLALSLLPKFCVCSETSTADAWGGFIGIDLWLEATVQSDQPPHPSPHPLLSLYISTRAHY